MEVATQPRPLVPAPGNGGFPEPTPGQPVRLVRAVHPGCEATLVRVPRHLPSRAVRVVVCGSCGESFEAPPVSEVGILAPTSAAPAREAVEPRAKAARSAPRLPKLPSLPRPALGAKRPSGLRLPSMPRVSAPSLPAYAAVPVAIFAVLGALVLIQAQNASDGGPNSTPAAPADATPQAPAAAPATPAPAAGSASAAAGDAKLIRGSNFTIALPPGWQQRSAANGATFSAASADGDADATLWVRDAPKLDFPTFEASSLAQLRTLAGSAHVASRVAAPTPEATIVRLAADAPAGKPAYDVTLRVSGPYRYYLATTLQPGASDDATKGVELLSNSLTPVSAGAASSAEAKAAK